MSGFAVCIAKDFGVWGATYSLHEQHLQDKQSSILTRAPRAGSKPAESDEGMGDVGKCPDTWGYAASVQ